MKTGGKKGAASSLFIRNMHKDINKVFDEFVAKLEEKRKQLL